MIDAATLTGAVSVALGAVNIGLMSNNDSLQSHITTSGRAIGEQFWALPMNDEYLEPMKGDLSDLRNAGTDRKAGTITAAKFLEQFVDGTPWATSTSPARPTSTRDCPTRQRSLRNRGAFARAWSKTGRTEGSDDFRTEAIVRLKEGNERFVSGSPLLESLANPERRSELASGQEPFAIILGCSDSRVPSEIVFDFSLGHLFVIRVAGNIVAPSQIGSIEYATSQFGTRLVVVLGHQNCGAVSATISELRQPSEDRSPNLSAIVDRVRPAVEPLMGGTWTRPRCSSAPCRRTSANQSSNSAPAPTSSQPSAK